ncbi:MAG: hypothetical protein KGN79_07665 [Acidobacteriota bacterium]|nr:hypothetical protein [Acidobacteriota bacterium]
MNVLIENLAKLQAVELERTRVSQSIRALPAEVTQAELLLAEAQQAAAAANSELEREDRLREKIEREAETHRKKAAHFREQQDSVTTTAQAEAIEHELTFAKAEIERLENEEYASLERTEAQETALAAARAQVERRAEDLEETRVNVEARRQKLAQLLEEFGAEREMLRKQIDPDWLARFDRIVANRGTGIARGENQQCTGCRMGLRPQIWNQLREGELLNCDSCGRLIYWDDRMTPAPKAPQAEKARSDGHAIRRPSQAGAHS